MYQYKIAKKEDLCMRNERKIKGHFFLTHFAIVIPILLTSFIATYFISYEASRQNKKMLYQQIDNFAEGFAEIYLLQIKQPGLQIFSCERHTILI